jgi:hypothetical protein
VRSLHTSLGRSGCCQQATRAAGALAIDLGPQIIASPLRENVPFRLNRPRPKITPSDATSECTQRTCIMLSRPPEDSFVHTFFSSPPLLQTATQIRSYSLRFIFIASPSQYEHSIPTVPGLLKERVGHKARRSGAKSPWIQVSI